MKFEMVLYDSSYDENGKQVWVVHTPNWWVNFIRHINSNSIPNHRRYSHDKYLNRQLKPYRAVTERVSDTSIRSLRTITFESHDDYTYFVLKWA